MDPTPYDLQLAVAQQDNTTSSHWQCRLLHPFMPFVTEELWQRLPHPPHSNTPQDPSASSAPPADNAAQTSSSQQASSSDRVSIMVQLYPEVQPSWQNAEVEEQMQVADTIVRAVRKLRNDYGLQRQRPQLFIQVWLPAVTVPKQYLC